METEIAIDPYEIIDGIKIQDVRPRRRHLLIRWFRKTKTKGGILIPEYRHRANFMKGEILAVGEGCEAGLRPGVIVEFNGLGEKEWLGVQNPADRDTVFFTREENIFCIVSGQNGKTSVQAVGDWVFIKPDPGANERNGLLIPEPARDRQRRRESGLLGTIISGWVGPGFKQGQRVVFNATAAIPIRLGDHNADIVLIIDADDVEGEVESDVV